MHEREDLNRFAMIELLQYTYPKEVICLAGGNKDAVELVSELEDDDLWILLHSIETLNPIEWLKKHTQA